MFSANLLGPESTKLYIPFDTLKWAKCLCKKNKQQQQKNTILTCKDVPKA